MQYLEHNYDLSKCTMVGSSAGSMLSVLAACDVEPQVCLVHSAGRLHKQGMSSGAVGALSAGASHVVLSMHAVG